jgi:hypothetical protein
LSGKSIRANCGLKAPAQRERRRAVLELFLLRAEMADGDEGMKESSRREVRYWVRLEEISFSV